MEEEKKLPVPRHLEKIFQADLDETDTYELKGTLKCTCGCEQFSLKTYSCLRKNGCLGVTRYKDGYALVIQAKCRKCGGSRLVFDMSRHGYNGYVCHEGVQVPDSELEPYRCPECKKNLFLVEIGMEVEVPEQFAEEVVAYEPETYAEEDYVDAFDWITISVECAGCGHKVRDWVNFETS